MLVAALTAAAMLPPSVASGQESPETLRAHRDSLMPLLEEARQELAERKERNDEARRLAAARATRVDTLHVGPLTVLTPAGQADETRALVTEVWEESFAGLGDSPALSRSVFAYQRVSGDPLPIHMAGGGHTLYPDRWTSRSRLKRDLRSLIAGAMSHDLRASRALVGDWVRGNALDAEPWEATYRRIATTSSKVSRACLAGDPEACGSAMALWATDARDVDEIDRRALFAEWYTPDERRARVASHNAWRSRRAEVLKARCRQGDDIEACDEYMADFGWDWAPLGQEVRESLVAYALQRGGAGAWGRLFEHPETPPAEALEHASGQPIDELLADWRAELVAQRPESFEPLVPSSGRTLLWTLLFAAMALRSTRWRLG